MLSTSRFKVTLASCSTELVMQPRSILSSMSAQTRVLSMSLTDLGVQSIYLTDLSAGTILALDILFCVWRRSLTRLTAHWTYQADLALVYCDCQTACQSIRTAGSAMTLSSATIGIVRQWQFFSMTLYIY